MEGVHPDSPGYERKQPPSFLPLIVQVEGHALVCNGCGSLVLDNPNALSAHRDFHAR